MSQGGGGGAAGCHTASHPKLQWAGFDLETEVGTVCVRVCASVCAVCVPAYPACV